MYGNRRMHFQGSHFLHLHNVVQFGVCITWMVCLKASLSLQVNRGSLIFETDNDQQVSSWTTELKECISNR